MLSFTAFELYAILSNLNMMDTIFGNVPVRDEIIEQIFDFLDENSILPTDDFVDIEVLGSRHN